MAEMEKKTTEEKIQDFTEKLSPYIVKLWVKKKKFLIINAVVIILTLTYLLFIAKPYYESSVVILPEYGSKSNMLSQLGSLAALAGVKVGESAPTEIYQYLLASESVLGPVIYSKYKTNEYPDSVNLIQYFKVKVRDNDAIQKERKEFLELYELLVKAKITAEIERMTKILTVKVVMPESQLSADVANRIVESLDTYVRTKRKSFASEQLFYLDKRTSQVKDSLTVGENELKNFREQNRLTTQSPNLMLEQARLMRNVEILQTVFIELTKQLELAKLDEIKDAPVINVKEYAKDPIMKTGPKRVLALELIFFFSIVFSVLYIMTEDKQKKYGAIVYSSYLKYFRS